MSQKVVISCVNTENLPKMSAKESEEMLRRIKNGENHLKEEFVEGNMRLVLSMVKRFNSDKVSADDLFQVGMLGLIKAMNNFNVELNVRFSTYAVPMILGEMRRFLRENSSLKIGRSIRDIAYRAMIARDELEKDTTKEIGIDQISDYIGVPYSEVVSALDAISQPISLYESVYSDEDDSLMMVDTLSDKQTEEDLINKITLREELDKLPQREKDVLLLRYYKGRTQVEISEELDMSQAQISRLERTAISKLKKVF